METDNTDNGSTTITQEQYDELKTQLSAMNDLVKAKDESIMGLEAANAKIVEEKRAEMTKVETERQAKMIADGNHEDLLKEREAEWNKREADMLGKVDTLSNQLHGMTGDSALSATLDSVGINPAMKSVVEQNFRHSWSFDEKGSVMHDGIPLADSVKKWADSTDGKPFLLSKSSGSGAQPTTLVNTQSKEVKDMTLDERMAHMEAGNSLTD